MLTMAGVPESQMLSARSPDYFIAVVSLIEHLSWKQPGLNLLVYPHPKGWNMQTPEDNLDTLQDVENTAFRSKNGALRFGDHLNR